MLRAKLLTVAGVGAAAVVLLAGCGGPSLHDQKVSYLNDVSKNVKQMQTDAGGFAKAGQGLVNKTMTFKEAKQTEADALVKVDADIKAIEAEKAPNDPQFQQYQSGMTDTLNQYDAAMHEMVNGLGDTPETTNINQVEDATKKILNLMPKLQDLDTQFTTLQNGVK